MNKCVVKSLVLLVLLCFGIGAWADNVVSLSSVQGAPGEEVSVNISLQNSDAISSLQVSIPLDENLTLVEGSGKLGSRCSGHSLTVGVKDGALQVFVYSLSMAAFTGNGGEVATFRLKLGNQPKAVSLSPSKTVLTNTNGKPVTGKTVNGTVTIESAKAEYSTTEVDFGRVPIRSTYTKNVTVTNTGNADLVITSLDFSDVNVFSSTTTLPLTVKPGGSSPLNITYAPVNRGSIERTLKVGCNSSSKLNTIRLKAQPFAVNELHVQPVSGIADEEVTVRMTMNNMDAVSGYQVEFEMPEQLQFVDGSFTLSDRKQDHTSVVSMIDNVLRIIVYSPTDKPLTGNDGEIGSFKVKLTGRNSVELKSSRAVLSATINHRVDDVMSAVYGAVVTISSPRISTDGTLDFGAVPVTEEAERSFTISNYGDAPLTVSRIVFDNENLTVKETLPLTVNTGSSQTVTVVYGSEEQASFEARMQIYSNDPDQRLQEVKVTGSRFAPNFIAVSTPNAFTKGNLSVNIDADTYDAISGLQFDLVYPSQYYEPYDGNIVIGDKAEGLTVTARETDNNTLKYFCYFLSGNELEAGCGRVMTIQLKPKDGSVPEGTYKVYVKNIKLATKEMADKYAGTDVESAFTVINDNTPVTITAKSFSIAYGESLPAFEYTIEGNEIMGEPEITCAATTKSPVGTYPIVIKKGSVTNNNATYVNGTLTITKAPLTIMAKSYSIKQGEPLPKYVVTYSGFKNGETASVLTKQPTVTCAATAASEPGTYDIIVSGAAADNYEISYVKGTLKIRDLSTLKGDINVDGEIDVTDVVELIDMVLAGIYDVAGDINGDGEVDVTDVVELIDMVLSGE